MAERLTLAFDTSGAYCAAAITAGDKVMATKAEDMRKGQAERLMSLLEEVLAETGAIWTDIDAIGVGIGPGNFTGVRIAVAAARGLALGLDIPAEGVRLSEAYAAGRDVIVCLPALRDMVHFCHDGAIELRAADAIPTGWNAPLTGPMANRVADTTGRGTLPTPDLATQIARIAAARAAPGRPRPAPVYLRPADAAPASDPPPVILP